MRKQSWRLLAVLVAASIGGCAGLVPYEEAIERLPSGEFLDIDGTSVHIERVGGGMGAGPVILVHGFGASTFSWRHVIPELSESHPVVAVDLYGFGLTERPRKRSRYSRSAQVQLLASVLEELEWPSAHFVGHSYGGGLAMSLAHTQPDKVRSLVLVGSTSPDYGDTRRTIFAVPPLANLFVHTLLRPRFVRRSLARSFHDDEAVTDDLVAAYLARVKIRGAIRAYRGLTGPRRPDPRFADFSYERLAQPTLLVWGADDQLIAADDGRAAAERLPHGRFVAIQGCGHLPMEEKPEELLAELVPFLREVDALQQVTPSP
ncbi:MAG: alpha/beta fold hydrolase [Thermoanaerobaculia bacterium]